MYELARGPLMWVATLVFIAGVAYRAFQFFRHTRRKQRVAGPQRNVRADSPEERKARAVLAVQNSFPGQHPVMAIVSSLFHACLLVVPLITLGHNLLLRESWGVSFFSMPHGVIQALTILVLVGVLFFLVRRLVIPQVRAISTTQDYVVLLLAAAPFLTGFMAYRQWFDYRTVLTIHMLAGELVLIVLPFTKLAHMVFFLLARIFLVSEFNVSRGTRTWST